VTGIEETVDSIFVHLRGASIPVRKSGFPYIELQKNFVEFAQARYQNSNRPELTQ
jgi:hypothetical protein